VSGCRERGGQVMDVVGGSGRRVAWMRRVDAVDKWTMALDG